MKHVSAKSTVDMLHKNEIIEKQVMDLKLSVLKKLTPSGQKVISLKGILKGVDITEQDIASAKRNLFIAKYDCEILMNFVADTQALLWWFTDSPKISSKAEPPLPAPPASAELAKDLTPISPSQLDKPAQL